MLFVVEIAVLWNYCDCCLLRSRCCGTIASVVCCRDCGVVEL